MLLRELSTAEKLMSPTKISLKIMVVVSLADYILLFLIARSKDKYIEECWLQGLAFWPIPSRHASRSSSIKSRSGGLHDAGHGMVAHDLSAEEG